MEVRRELAIATEKQRRMRRAAEEQEERGDALVARLALEADIQAELRQQTKRAKERTAVETARAEVAERRLTETKVVACCCFHPRVTRTPKHRLAHSLPLLAKQKRNSSRHDCFLEHNHRQPMQPTL